MKIGFIGLGNMGLPMARNLFEAGFDLVLWNRTRAKIARVTLDGARSVATPAELARRVEIVLLCLRDERATEEALLGAEGVFSASRPAQIVVDHGTEAPDAVRRFHELALGRGAFFLDAPVSGGPDGARRGQLTIMVGGEESAFARAMPIFRVLGKTIVHMGGPGAGAAAKLVNQLLVGVHSVASCEALLLADRLGLDRKRLLPILARSWGASRMLARNAPVILEGRFGPSGAPLRNLVKDLEIVVRTAAACGLELPLASRALRVHAEAAGESGPDRDLAAVYDFLGEKAAP